MNSKVSQKYFEGDNPHQIAKSLLGKVLVRKNGSHVKAGIIVETEVYDGFSDKASHASKSRTKRNEIMFGPGGFYYVYLIYGMYWNLNIITGKTEHPSGILVRALEPIVDSENDLSSISFAEKFRLASGPGKLCRWLGIDKSFYGKSVEGTELFIVNKSEYSLVNTPFEIVEAKRIGVSYAEESADLLWRYYIKDNKFVSKK